ncbi:MAG: hypothetical protein ABL967_13060 [Bryobacteraceae bacterium]
MKRNLKSGCLCVCLLAVALPGMAQDQPSSTTAPNAAAAPAPPREVPSDVNSGRGLSVEPIYWMTTARGGIRKGAKSASSAPGDLDYNSSPKEMVGAVVTVPAGKTNAVRVTYLATRNFTTAAGSIAPTALSLFGTDIGNGDPIAVSYKLQNVKLSYDFLTYFFKKGNTDFRIKTLWEIQYFSINNSIVDFIPLSDGTFAPTPFTKDRSIITPTFGIGLEHTISRHFRWEAKASAFALPHRSTLIDSEASLALRFGRLELLGGGKLYHFKSNVQNDNYVSGDVYGPYAGIRFYWKKQ